MNVYEEKTYRMMFEATQLGQVVFRVEMQNQESDCDGNPDDRLGLLLANMFDAMSQSEGTGFLEGLLTALLWNEPWNDVDAPVFGEVSTKAKQFRDATESLQKAIEKFWEQIRKNNPSVSEDNSNDDDELAAETIPQLRTVSVLAGILGVSVSKIQHLLRYRDIKPVAKAGNYRLYDADAVDRLRVELKLQSVRGD